MSVRIVAKYNGGEVLLLDTEKRMGEGDYYDINLVTGKVEVMKRRNGWLLHLGPWSIENQLPMMTNDRLSEFKYWLFGVVSGIVLFLIISEVGF